MSQIAPTVQQRKTIIEKGSIAAASLNSKARVIWETWIEVGHAVIEIRRLASFDPDTIKQYPDLMKLHPSDRINLVHVMNNLDEINKWRDGLVPNGLTENERLAWTHPSTIWRHWHDMHEQSEENAFDREQKQDDGPDKRNDVYDKPKCRPKLAAKVNKPRNQVAGDAATKDLTWPMKFPTPSAPLKERRIFAKRVLRYLKLKPRHFGLTKRKKTSCR